MKEQKHTILVTGSSGRIGYPVAKRLSESFNVVGFDRRAPSHPPPSAECLYVDLTSDVSLRRGLQAIRDVHGTRIASVIHLAAYYDFSGAPSPLYEMVTVRGTERLLRMLQDFEVEQFIFSSTDLVYAPSAPGQHINEESPLDPKWPYPQSKVETEKVIHAERGNIPTVILRIAGVYDDLCHSIPLAQQIQRIYEHDITAYLFPGDVTSGRQAFVHNEDVGFALMGTGIALLATAQTKPLVFAFVALLSLGMAFIAPLLALISKRGGERQAGASLGIQNAANNLGQSVGPLLGGVLFIWQTNAPYLLSGTLLIALALGIAWKVAVKRRSTESTFKRGEQS